MKLSIEQLLLLFFVLGVPILRAIMAQLRERRGRTEPEAAADFSEPDEDSSDLDEDFPELDDFTSQSERLRSEPPRQEPTLVPVRLPPYPQMPLRSELSKVSRLETNSSINQSAESSAALRKIPRNITEQRRAIVLIAVFGPPRSLEPPP